VSQHFCELVKNRFLKAHLRWAFKKRFFDENCWAKIFWLGETAHYNLQLL